MMIAPACEVPDSAAEILALFAEARRNFSTIVLPPARQGSPLAGMRRHGR